MKQPKSLEQFCEYAQQLGGSGRTLLVNQADYTPEDAIVPDEDTSGGVNMQVVRLLACTGEDAVYWAEPVYDSGELEQMNVKLAVLADFDREVVTENELNKRKNETGLHENSIQKEAD
ncbi:hypothetical protein [Sporosarcina trichiuri]|uniref:hypothetical protein n=1 Tax=Sporosarcina trichiuri TaxID=3056445 RepID=UPI0025B5007D|nr:hypothetical protein [Sporosarcina sp. 0.2-SM1T-5]WJY28378.1 hypothetical protein QWT68_05195 [Sporosarcina sp. 0.2-SM1T-5]